MVHRGRRALSAVPIIPAREIKATTAWYRDRLGFTVAHTEREYGTVTRDDVQVHFWGPSGIGPRDSMTVYRLEARDIADLYEHCQAEGIVHPNAPLQPQAVGHA